VAWAEAKDFLFTVYTDETLIPPAPADIPPARSIFLPPEAVARAQGSSFPRPDGELLVRESSSSRTDDIFAALLSFPAHFSDLHGALADFHPRTGRFRTARRV
jgi:hypothetical protein